MERIKADYWTQENVVKLQIRTKIGQTEIQRILPGWQCVSYGYVPKTMEDIYVFERVFTTESDLTDFIKSDTIIKQLEMREVL
jgi:hypothetical protein